MKKTLINLIRDDCEQVTNGRVDSLSRLKGECILVTGGTGFIGTWIAELVTFLNDTYDFNTKLIVLADKVHDFDLKAPHLAAHKNVTFIEQDVRNILEIPSEVNWIIHAAATPDNRIHASDPLKTAHVIIKGTDSILMAATRLPNLQKFLNLSSGLVYGNQSWELAMIPEDFRGVLDFGSISCAYAEAKRMAENLCAIYRNQYRLAIVNARPFAFIGPYQLLDRPWAINNFIRDSLLGGPIRILGDGETIRSYMYPSDMAFWILTMLVHGQVGSCYNLGSSQSINLIQLAEKIANNFPTPLQVVLRFAKDGRYLSRSKFVPDTTLARKTFGLELQVDIETAIKRTLLWNRHLLN